MIKNKQNKPTPLALKPAVTANKLLLCRQKKNKNSTKTKKLDLKFF